MPPRGFVHRALYIAAAAILIGVFNAPSAQEEIPGKRVYLESRSECHGPQGGAPVLTPFVWDYDQLLRILRSGGCEMPSFSQAELSDADIKHIVDYLKTVK